MTPRRSWRLAQLVDRIREGLETEPDFAAAEETDHADRDAGYPVSKHLPREHS